MPSILSCSQHICFTLTNTHVAMSLTKGCYQSSFTVLPNLPRNIKESSLGNKQTIVDFYFDKCFILIPGELKQMGPTDRRTCLECWLAGENYNSCYNSCHQGSNICQQPAPGPPRTRCFPDERCYTVVLLLQCCYLVFIPHMEGAVDPAVVIKNLFIFIFSIHISQYMIITLLDTPELV